MKKKYRDIVVNNIKYAWAYSGEGDGGTLKIWKDKKVIYTENFNHDVIITPSYVSVVIKKLK